jgi:AraC-like DNA-binding protein
MSQDPFSNVLSIVDVRSAVSGGFTAGGTWAIRFPRPDRIKFFTAVKGECWLQVEGDEAPVRFCEGDVFLLTAARSFTLASDLDAEPHDAIVVYAGGTRRIPNISEGDDFMFLGGHVLLDAETGNLLIDNLPATVRLAAGTVDASILKWLIDRLVCEHSEERPGMDFATSHLAQLMFLQILRSYLANIDDVSASRLRAINDPRIAPALRLMHKEPSRSWHLVDLAKASAMSRTAFAVYFKSVAGIAPLTYLTEWRMRLAERALRETDQPLAIVASSLGYTSESAFSTAFKRVTGHAPTRYRTVMKRKLKSTGPGVGLEPQTA